MAYKRYLVEFDTGVDLHGMNVTKAAQKAIKGAISHCCMCGMEDLLKIEKPMRDIRLDVRIGAPYPEKVDVSKVKETLPPYQNVNIEVVEGGMTAKGLHVASMGEGDTIVMVNAAITVWVNTDYVTLQ